MMLRKRHYSKVNLFRNEDRWEEEKNYLNLLVAIHQTSTKKTIEHKESHRHKCIENTQEEIQ